MAKEKEETTLADFNWDNPNDFFGSEANPTTKIETTTNIKEVDEDNDGEEADKLTNQEEGEQPDKEQDKFSFDDEDEVEGKSTTPSSQWSSTYKLLKDKGIISIDVEEGEEIDEEKLAEIIEEEIQTGLDETIQEFMDELDEDAKAFLKFKKEGGDTKQFFQIYAQMSEVPEPGNDVKSQKKFLEYYYRVVEDMEDEDIEDKISWMEETGKLSKYANKYYEEFEQNQESIKEDAVKKQQEMRMRQEENKKQLIKDLKHTIDSVTEIKDWSITQKDKKELHGYMTKTVEKTANGQYLTKFQSDLQKVFADKEKMILLAKIMHNDFDVKDIKEKAKTEVIKQTKQKLESNKQGSVNNKGSRNKGLADFF
jgi:hypothetical protein